jgi:ketosteroid isomerase-like protein
MNALDALCDYFERLSAGNLGELDAYYAADAWFKDPFHEVTGVAAIRAILEHTFDKLPGARFRVTGRFPGPDQQAVILWEMDFVMPITRRPTTISGATHLSFDATGRVTRHRDYCDAAEELYARLPVLKWLMRGLARQAAAPL